jgi:hypothetical protein
MTREKRPNRKRAGLWLISILITLGSITVQQGYAQQKNPTACTLATLNGLYVFDASGYNIVNQVPQPKAVVEFLDFKGDGTLTSKATVSLDGVIHSGIAGSGSYTVNQDCTGSLTFNGSGFSFDLFVAPHGRRFHMIQTDSDTVLAGESRRVH